MNRGSCAVCGSPNATNLHFGAQACKACAAFFRRSITTGQLYDCIGDGSTACHINHSLRLNCRHCRFTKCLQAGMNEDLVQGKRKNPNPNPNLASRSHDLRRDSLSGDHQSYEQVPIQYYETPMDAPNASKFLEQPFPGSEMEYNYSPPPQKVMRMTEDIMGPEELCHFIQLPAPGPSSSFSTDVETSASVIRIMCSKEDLDMERAYALSTLYIDQVVNLNMRRRLTYTDQQLGAIFDGPCICPFERKDLKPFDHRRYRRKSRNDYTMVLDYINRFPEFDLLNKSEKNVLFQTAAAVDTLVAKAYYSQYVFPDESILVTRSGEFIPMDPVPDPESQQNHGDDHAFYKALILIFRRQWKHVVEPLKKLKMSLAEFALFKALTIWHYNYYKLQDTGRQICARQRDEIFRTLLIICKDEGYEDALLRVSELVLAVGIVMAEVHEMVTSFIEIMVFDDVDDPILRDMLRFQY